VIKYEDLQTTHLFVPIAIETSDYFSKTGLEFITELGNRLKLVAGDKLELTYLFQRLFIAIQRCHELCFNGTFVPRWYSYCVTLSLSLSISFPYTQNIVIVIYNYNNNNNNKTIAINVT